MACSAENTEPVPDGPGAEMVIADAETAPVDGDVDDPAIWVDAANPESSAIIGTDKRGGVEVYDLSGARLHRRDDGKLNNVDVRGDVVAATNRSDDTVVVYRIGAATRELVPAGRFDAGLEVYGMCLYLGSDGVLYAFANSKTGEIAQLAIDLSGPTATGRLVRTLSVPTQPEGCVADDALDILYVGEEDVGIWRFDARPEADTDGVLVADTGGDDLVADVEGLALYRGDGTAGYLLASSQGDNAYAVYRRDDNEFLGRFRVTTADGDPVSESDGIDVTSASLGTAFPCGLFVAHDTRNEGFTANFKLVRWELIADAIELPSDCVPPRQGVTLRR